MKIELEVTRAVVVRTATTDKVSLTTNFPSPYPPQVNTAPLVIRFEVAGDWGRSYVLENFGVDPEIISTASAKQRDEAGG